jgi:hypothetical protein
MRIRDMKCDKCGAELTHFTGFTLKYFHLCKPCYDEELTIISEEEARESKKQSSGIS